MAISSKSNRIVSCSTVCRLQTLLLNSHRLNHTLAGDVSHAQREFSPDTVNKPSCYDTSTWKVVDSRIYGIDYRKISPSSWTILKILRGKGYQAYLVGGCVRDLLLNKIPKDFDVITNAKLKEIKRHFQRVWIVGQAFPICQVFIKGSMVEVSSFDTVASHSLDKEKVSFSERPTGCNENDFIRWRNCLHRDFTINSLFYDPSVNKIYDYANGLRDVKFCKVQTVIPAQLSFTEDCARILRGIRIAARLGLSFSDETANAIHRLHLSIRELNKARLMREVNFMFSYGAAASSLYLLKRFKILDILLPVQAAYLSQQAHKQTAQNSVMLFELFSNMDKLLGSDRPSASSLWVALLAFHLTLVNNPQDALVICAFSSVLYHGDWNKALVFARRNAQRFALFSPEILGPCSMKSDEELAKDVNHLASLVKSSIASMTNPENLVEPFSELVFISKILGQKAAKIFNLMEKDVTSCQTETTRVWINYMLLEKGDLYELRFVLGRVIMDTMIIKPLPEVVERDLSQKSYISKSHDVLGDENQRSVGQKPAVREKDQSAARKEHLNQREVNKQPSNLNDVRRYRKEYSQEQLQVNLQQADANIYKRRQQVVKEKRQPSESTREQEQQEVENRRHKRQHVLKEQGLTPESDPKQQRELDKKHSQPLSSLFR